MKFPLVKKSTSQKRYKSIYSRSFEIPLYTTFWELEKPCQEVNQTETKLSLSINATFRGSI